MTTQKDIEFVKKLLPATYKVTGSKSKKSIHCKSKKGIFKGIDTEDEERWRKILNAIKKHFGSRLSEVFHNVCYNHTDFTIYLN